MNEQKKTVREWLNELPEPIRTRAMKNEDGDFTNLVIVDTLQEAINLSFFWKDTTEDIDYWGLVSDGNYSEACALLGETLVDDKTEQNVVYELPQNAKPLPTKTGEKLQTEQTEPEQTKDLELTESEFIDVVADKVATEQYGKFWFELDDSQKAHLVKPIAIRYAELVNNQKQ